MSVLQVLRYVVGLVHIKAKERDAMLSVAPMSVMLFGVLGMFVIAFAVAKMTMLERQVRRPALHEPIRRTYAGSGV